MKSRSTSTKKALSTISTMSLGDLISAVSSYAQNERETIAAIQDLFRRGSVVAKTTQGSKRLKLA